MEQRKIIHMLDATVDDLLDGFVEVDNFTVSEILHDRGYLDEVPMEEWDDLIAIVADRVREELRNIHDAWRAGVL